MQAGPMRRGEKEARRVGLGLLTERGHAAELIEGSKTRIGPPRGP